MSTLFRKPLILGLAAVIPLTSTGCFYNALDVTVLGGTLFIQTSAFVGLCDEIEPREYECVYFHVDETTAISTVALSNLEVGFLLLFLDPVVAQFPADATNFSGGYFHSGSGTSGALEVTTGLASIRVDATRSLVAEPGTQLVIIELPDSAPTDGDYIFDFSFDPPPAATSVDVKAMFTGRVDIDGERFYPPLVPCFTDFASVPTVSIPVADGTVLLSLGDVVGCDNAVYDFLGAVPRVRKTWSAVKSLFGE